MSIQRWVRSTFFAFLLLAHDRMAAANLLVNGGFELPVLDAGIFVTLSPGTEPLGFGWTVTSGTVDVGNLPNPFIAFASYEGHNALDLNGNNRGAVAQQFTTVPGQTYRLSFVYSDVSAEGGISSASIDVTDVISGTTLLHDSVSHSTSTNGPPPDADARVYSGSFSASGPFTNFSLASTSASNSGLGGILLDAVDVVLALGQCDINADGAVDAADAAIMFGDWGGPGLTSQAHKNGDGFVDAADAAVLFAEWSGDGTHFHDRAGSSQAISATPYAVPEPIRIDWLSPVAAATYALRSRIRGKHIFRRRRESDRLN